MLGRLFRRNRENNNGITQSLYEEIVAASRQPTFYSDWGAPDIPLGRFELISLHMLLFLRRAKGKDPALNDISQEMTDQFFLEVDHSLRELGIGDMGVPKRMKKLAKMFYGRAETYTDAINAGDQTALAAALERNIWPDKQAATPHNAAALAAYVLAAADMLGRQSDADIVAGRLSYPVAGDMT